jgi:hypothetical protein
MPYKLYQSNSKKQPTTRKANHKYEHTRTSPSTLLKTTCTHSSHTNTHTSAHTRGSAAQHTRQAAHAVGSTSQHSNSIRGSAARQRLGISPSLSPSVAAPLRLGGRRRLRESRPRCSPGPAAVPAAVTCAVLHCAAALLFIVALRAAGGSIGRSVGTPGPAFSTSNPGRTLRVIRVVPGWYWYPSGAPRRAGSDHRRRCTVLLLWAAAASRRRRRHRAADASVLWQRSRTRPPRRRTRGVCGGARRPRDAAPTALEHVITHLRCRGRRRPGASAAALRLCVAAIRARSRRRVRRVSSYRHAVVPRRRRRPYPLPAVAPPSCTST